MAAKKLGLALGAGSARGFAHIGVLEVLEQNHIPVDVIAGSSMGAVIGGIYSCGTDLGMIQKVLPCLNEKEYFDVVVPRSGGFIKGERFQELIRIFTKGYTFEQTKIPFACVAVDIRSGELVEMQEGRLDDAIRASIAIPAVIAPHEWRGRLLVDGCVISRVPCQTARRLGADVVVGVDVGYRGGPIDYAFGKKYVDYVQATFDILQWEVAKNKEQEADIMLTPAVRSVAAHSIKDAQECIEQGRICAQQALPRIKELLEIA